MSATAIDQLYSEFSALIETVNAAAEPSLAVTANDVFRKALLLAAASEFEVQITETIATFAESKLAAASPVVGLVRNKALARQYHTLFKWDAANANQFFGLFGAEFKRHAEAAVSADPDLKEAVVAFLRLGDDRNRLVHQGFGTYVLEKTTEEIYQQYKKAAVFVARVPVLLATSPT